MKALQHIALAAVLTFSTFTSVAHANDFAAILGMRTNSWDLEPSGGTSASGKNSFQGGVLGFIDFSNALVFRTGFIYTQRAYTLKSGATNIDYDYTYFDIPATLMYKFSDFGGIFGGAVIALNTNKACSASTGTCSTDGVNSSVVGLQFGASFKFAPQLGGEIYYEMIPGPIQSNNGVDAKNAKSVVANFMITFE